MELLQGGTARLRPEQFALSEVVARIGLAETHSVDERVFPGDAGTLEVPGGRVETVWTVDAHRLGRARALAI